MINNINKRLKKYKNARFDKDRFIREYYLDESGNAVIKIVLKNSEDAFSRYSLEDFEELDSDFADYIDGVVYDIPLKHPIVLQINSDSLSEQDKSKLFRVIRDYYGLRYADKNQDLFLNTLKVLGLFAVGACLLIFSYFLASNGSGQFFTDLMNIAGTFALWEMIDLILLERRDIKIEKLNAGQTATADIIFSENK